MVRRRREEIKRKALGYGEGRARSSGHGKD